MITGKVAAAGEGQSNVRHSLARIFSFFFFGVVLFPDSPETEKRREVVDEGTLRL